MHYTLIATLILWISRQGTVSGEFQFYQSIRDDLKKLNATCNEEETCSEQRYIDSLNLYACNCDVNCIQLGTCCLDSHYVDLPRPKLKPTCRSVNRGIPYFMVDSCSSRDNVLANLCGDEWNGEDDVLKVVPVTSLFTSITYKNYFCFRCHEANDEFVYWNVKLESDYLDEDVESKISSVEVNDDNLSVKYDQSENTWMALIDSGGTIQVPVNLVVQPPFRIMRLVKECKRDVISNCSQAWTDADVSEKCRAYMSVKEFKKDRRRFQYLKYKNVHCALCNFQSVDNMKCDVKESFGGGGDFSLVSFVYVLDANKSGDGKTQNCSEGHIWDPYAKSCRKV